MDHCVICGRIEEFAGKLNKKGECADCVLDRRIESRKNADGNEDPKLPKYASLKVSDFTSAN